MKLKASCIAGLASVLCAPFAAQADELPIEALAQQPALSSVSMSGNGRYVVALLRPDDNESDDLALAVWDMENPDQPPQATLPSDRMKFIFAEYVGAGKILAVARQEFTGELAGCGEGARTGSTRTFVVKPYITDVELDDFDEPFARGGRTIGVSEATERCFELAGDTNLAQELPGADNKVIIERFDQVKFVAEYYEVDLETGNERLVYRATDSEVPLYFDWKTGELMAKTTVEPLGNGEYQILTEIRSDSGGFETHHNLTSLATTRNTVNIVGRDDETGKYYVSTDLFSDNTAIYMYDARTRQFDDEALFATQGFNATSVVLGTKPSNYKQVLGFSYGGPRYDVYWVDPEWVSITEGLKQVYPGKDIDIINYTDDLSKIMFSVSSSTTPPVYYFLHDRARVELFGAERPWINSAELRETEFVRYPARDGMQIPGFLTLPADWSQEDGPLPAVVLPHGGPWARDNSDWDASGWPQFLASRGYAVLQPQYRGSDGWGRQLWLAGDNQWGLKMQDDKDDGAAWLVENGYADPDRIAIFGYSYGGFAAMAATVRPGGPFQCAIAGAGVSNLGRIGRIWSENKLQRAIQGRTVDGMDPSHNTDQANIPILVYHGDRDVRVPIFHGRDFYNAVQDKVDAKYLEIRDMPHSLPWYPEHHRQSLEAIEDFLADDCGLQPDR